MATRSQGKPVPDGFVLLATVTALRAQNAVSNADFAANAPLVTTWPGYTAGGSSPATIDSWTQVGNTGINGEEISNPFGPSDRTATAYCAFLQSTGAAFVQTISLAPGTTYLISFLAEKHDRVER